MLNAPYAYDNFNQRQVNVKSRDLFILFAFSEILTHSIPEPDSTSFSRSLRFKEFRGVTKILSFGNKKGNLIYITLK